jgi:hypothetical protein
MRIVTFLRESKVVVFKLDEEEPQVDATGFVFSFFSGEADS